jgi:hypothetical protein
MELEITGIIDKIYDPEFELDLRQYQNILIRNIETNVKFLLTVNLDNFPIIFHLNDPITVKGQVMLTPTGLLSITDTQDPVGYIRYNGKVYE